jgi:hypothetical protein
VKIEHKLTSKRNFGCVSTGGNDDIILVGGTYPDFTKVPGRAGNINFNNVASSFVCSPLL